MATLANHYTASSIISQNAICEPVNGPRIAFDALEVARGATERLESL